MSTRVLRPWTELVKLHPDVESGELTEAIFAIDLGAIASGDPNVPVVYRDPEAFFRATYLTADLRKLLEEVLASLSGKSSYNRVLKLRTPFGGGKSHTLAALLHAAKSRRALDVVLERWNEERGRAAVDSAHLLKHSHAPTQFADPGEVAVAVFDGEKFDARDGKLVERAAVGQASSLLSSGQRPEPQRIQTMWGWIAWQIDPEKAFPLVEGHDRDRVAPGGDVVRELLTKGASGRPVLLLLDEVLKYMERAAAVAVLDSTLQRQAKDFFQTLTVEVAGSTNAALVYSLTWSAREALGNVALLTEIDKLAARVDQLREPVTGDEILPILQRRLLGAAPDEAVASEIGEMYATAVTGMRRAYAEAPSEKQQAEEEGVILHNRMRSAYPFHPALIDIMRGRWAAVDDFQRTRGALRFLATCLYVLKKRGVAHAILGPGEVPLHELEVRNSLVKELGLKNDYDPVFFEDLVGPNARARKIDERLAREMPQLASAKPATKLATTIFAYSFGGLRREEPGEKEALPPGVTESELLAACVGPGLDNITATAVLSELRTSCLYLHYDGVRYCFKKDPNVTKLIEDAEQEVSREEARSKGQGPVRAKIREMLDQRSAGHHAAVVWPAKSHDIPDEEPRFLVGYLPLEFAGETKAEQERLAKELFSRHGDRLRRYRNGIGLAIPDKKQIEAVRRAVRYLLAIERVENKKQQLRLSKDQLGQLKERRQTEEGAAESALRELYTTVWLPRVEAGELGIEKVEKGGKPLQATGIHERVMELLTSQGAPKVHGSVTPRKIVERLRLGEGTVEGEPPRLGVVVSEVVEAFYRDIEPPRLTSVQVLRKAVAQGVNDRTFAYASGVVPKLGADNRFQVNRERVVFGRSISEDEVDLDSGFLMVPSAIPEPQVTVPAGETAPSQGGVSTSSGGTGTVEIAETRPQTAFETAAGRKRVTRLVFRATRDQLFKSFPAIANLADASDGKKVTIQVEGTAEEGYDPTWLRNAVEEPLGEADVERELTKG